MNIITCLRDITGRKDREQLARTEQVAQYVHGKKNVFNTEMAQIQVQAKKVHETAMQNAQESARLKQAIDDITLKVAMATGRFSEDE